jgi:hypothetical protein
MSYDAWQRAIARGAMSRVTTKIAEGKGFEAGVMLGLIVSGRAGSVFTQDDVIAEIKAEAKRLIDARQVA